jgi:hypothetical protein
MEPEKCSRCKTQVATKKIRIEPKADPRLGVTYFSCDDCTKPLVIRYDNRSDRQVIITGI